MSTALALLLAFALYFAGRLTITFVGRTLKTRLSSWFESVAPLAAPSKAIFVLLLVLLWSRLVATQGAPAEWVEYYAGLLLWVSLIWFVIRAVNVLVLGLRYQRAKGAPLPGVFRAIVNGAVYTLVFLVVLNRYYGIALGDLVFWGAALAVVLGIALQSVLWSLFAGLVIYFQDMFRVGDTILVGDVEGTVLEIEWRTTTLRSPSGDQITIPNWTVSQATVVNFHRPSRQHRVQVEVPVTHAAPPNAVARLLEDLACMADGVLLAPAPAALHTGAASFTLDCWVRDHAQRERVEDQLRRLAWYGLRRHGWSPQAPPAPGAEGDPRIGEALEGLELLDGFSPAGRRALADRLPVHIYGRGERLLVAGSSVESLHCLLSGSLTVRRAASESPDEGRLEAGAIIGADEFLRGSPSLVEVRVAEDAELVTLRREHLRELLRDEPAVLSVLAQRARRGEDEDTEAVLRARFGLGG